MKNKKKNPVLLVKMGAPATGKSRIEMYRKYSKRKLVEESINNTIERNKNFINESTKNMNTILIKYGAKYVVNSRKNKKPLTQEMKRKIMEILNQVSNNNTRLLGSTYWKGRNAKGSTLNNKISKNMRKKRDISFETIGGVWVKGKKKGAKNANWMIDEHFNSDKVYKMNIVLPLRNPSDSWNSYKKRTVNSYLLGKGQRHSSSKKQYLQIYINSLKGILLLLRQYKENSEFINNDGKVVVKKNMQIQLRNVTILNDDGGIINIIINKKFNNTAYKSAKKKIQRKIKNAQNMLNKLKRK